MTALAFYAPMKSPNHPVPSGDRTLARSLISAFQSAGHNVFLASELRIRDKVGDAAVQADQIQAAAQEIARLTASAEMTEVQAWVTYHSYYKSPDLIGPAVCRALGLPYLMIEATRASKRLSGPWATFAQGAEAACDAADAIFYLTQHDAEALLARRKAGQALVHLRPFLCRSDLPDASSRSGPMLSVGMMRQGDKLASYRVIAETLKHLAAPEWRLDIAGDGPARAEIEVLMAPFGKRVRFLGALHADALADCYGDAAMMLWPGVNEAFGMVYLEAQAAGVPVAAQDRAGVRDVLAPGPHPSVEAGAAALAARVDSLLLCPDLAAKEAEAARAYIRDHHLITQASSTLSRTLDQVLR